MKFSVKILVHNYTTTFKLCPRLKNYISQKVTELTGQADYLSTHIVSEFQG